MLWRGKSLMLRRGLSDYEQMYNSFRPHMGLGNLTPFEYYAELQEAELFLSHMQGTDTYS
ncbi:MAG: integrase core domain-containing protein [Spirochaetota bacterium]